MYAFGRLWRYLNRLKELKFNDHGDVHGKHEDDCNSFLAVVKLLHSVSALRWHDVIIAEAWARDIRKLLNSSHV
jgi:hypothetical protein